MIRAMHRAAPKIIALGALCLTYVATAQVVISNVPAPVVVTFPEVKVFVYTTLATVLLATVMIAGSIAAFVLSRDRAADTVARAALADAIEADHKVREEQFAVIGDAVRAVGESVKALAEVMTEHKRDPFAHPAVARSTHKALDDRIAEMKAEMDEHVQFCHTHQCAFGRRDPKDSPSPLRSTGPEGFDGRPLRGRP